jgi:hypothetical protein
MTCPTCGKPLEGSSKCRTCNPPVLTPDPVPIGIKGNPIGTVVATPRDHPDGSRVDYKPQLGGRALSETNSAGDFTAELSDPLDRGTSNEWHVLKVLKMALQEQGHVVKELPGAQDDRGEDGFLEIDGHKTTVQIVMMPKDEQLWRTLRTGGVSLRQGDLQAAVGLVRRSLEAKEFKARGALVALDAHHFAALVGRKLVEAYLAMHGNPVEEFQFRDVWIIGPTVPYSIRLAPLPT